MDSENDASVRELLRRSLDEPGDALSDVPALLDALDHGDRRRRIGAAWAICAVASERPQAVPRLRDQLAERSGSEATLAVTWLDRELVDDATGAAASECSAADSDRQGSNDDDETSPSRADAGSESPDGRSTEPSADSSDDRTTESSAESADDATTASAGSRGRATTSGDSTTSSDSDDDADADRSRPEPAERDSVVQNGRFTIELEETAFDALEIVDRVAVDRHAWTYAGMATVDARRHAVLVRSYRPPEGARLSTFGAAFEDVLEKWSGVDDHDGVLTIYDYGRRPRPWAVLSHVPETLRSTGALPLVPALAVTRDAAAGLAHAHERGVTHRSLDPRSLAIDRSGDRLAGRLLNVGVIDAFRAANGPLPIDSRFCAPELFDGEYGSVDRLTDVYQLGAVLYMAVTGRPPYDDSLVRRGGPADVPFDPPSAVVEGVPDVVDEIVETAMATHKIARYESADQLAVDVERAIESVESTATDRSNESDSSTVEGEDR